MTDINTIKKYDAILNGIGLALDISEEQYYLIQERYEAVASLLSKDNSSLKSLAPDVMPQGSFLLGTMIKPIVEDDELDVDVVCRLSNKPLTWTQYDVKHAVGAQIKHDGRYEKMLDKEGRRCWTLLYAEDAKFHMDILPAIVGSEHFTLLEKKFSDLNWQNIEALSVRITDKTLNNYYNDTSTLNWLKSNPFGYAGWFNERKKTEWQKKALIVESIKPLPAYSKEKSPLQRVVQLLKRHRDIMFGGDEDKPISIIITTLAARAYNGEVNVAEALLNVLSNMGSHIRYVFSNKHQRNIAWIENPVNAEENFADKWPDNSQKEENFFAWLDKAREDFKALQYSDVTQSYRLLKNVLGTKSVNEGFRNAKSESFINEIYLPSTFDTTLLNVPHREQPQWPLRLTYNLEIHGNYKQGKKQFTITPNTVVPKQCDIFFTASTNVPRPFDVYWQVVNTGREAEANGGLRGKIFVSKTLGVGGLRQKERSQYTGSHWIQCFIVKNGICVARSYEFLVNIE